MSPEKASLAQDMIYPLLLSPSHKPAYQLIVRLQILWKPYKLELLKPQLRAVWNQHLMHRFESQITSKLFY